MDRFARIDEVLEAEGAVTPMVLARVCCIGCGCLGIIPVVDGEAEAIAFVPVLGAEGVAVVGALGTVEDGGVVDTC